MKWKKGNKKKRSKEEENNLFNFIKFSDDYSPRESEARHEATKGTGHKILSPKQMLQRLPIALAQVKGGKITEKLLNKIHQIIYFCIDQKKLLKSKNGYYI